MIPGSLAAGHSPIVSLGHPPRTKVVPVEKERRASAASGQSVILEYSVLGTDSQIMNINNVSRLSLSSSRV